MREVAGVDFGRVQGRGGGDLNGTAGIGMGKGDEEGEVVSGISDGVYVFLEGGVEMELAGAHADYYRAVARGLEDGAEDIVLHSLRWSLRW